jgi:hypothetical protein
LAFEKVINNSDVFFIHVAEHVARVEGEAVLSLRAMDSSPPMKRATIATLRQCHLEVDLMSQSLNHDEIKNIIKRQADTQVLCQDICDRLGKSLDETTRERKRMRIEKERMKTSEEAAKAAAHMASQQAMWNGCWANAKATELNEAIQWLHAERATNEDLARRLAESDRKVAEYERRLFEYNQRYGPLPSVSLSSAAKQC